MLLAICAFSVLVPAACCLAIGSSTPSVVINNITFVGQSKSPDVDFFGGIPFAEPPLGDLRLRPPVLKSFLNDSGAGQTIFNATQFGPSCIQLPTPLDSAISEDCLSVNIFKPSSSAINGSSDRLPVMIWFYGGGFIIGSSSRYDGTPLVSRSILRGTPTIIVSINYRMGPLGFPRGDDVTREAEEGSPILNLGIRDGVAAIQWVKQHISAFGGDPDKVTIFGESAGALAIELLILNDQVRGLAKGAIMESTGGIPILSPSNPGANEKWNDFIAAIPRCQAFGFNDTVDCMRNITTSEIIEAYNTAGLFFNTSSSDWLPVVDGEIVPDFPTKLKPRKGVVEAILIGANLDEGTILAPQNINSSQPIRDAILSSPPSPPNASPQEREIQLEKLEHVVEQVLKLYPNDPSLGSPFGTGNDTFGLDPEYKRFSAVEGDLILQSYRRHLINNQLLTAEIPTFSYLFADPDAVAVPDFVSGPTAPGSLGVTHSSEIFYVFGNLSVVTPTATNLSNAMMDYWISFANNFSPNDGAGSARPFWSEYTLENKVMLQLNGHNTTMIPDDFREEQIAIFNEDPSLFGR